MPCLHSRPEALCSFGQVSRGDKSEVYLSSVTREMEEGSKASDAFMATATTSTLGVTRKSFRNQTRDLEPRKTSDISGLQLGQDQRYFWILT